MAWFGTRSGAEVAYANIVRGRTLCVSGAWAGGTVTLPVRVLASAHPPESLESSLQKSMAEVDVNSHTRPELGAGRCAHDRPLPLSG